MHLVKAKNTVQTFKNSYLHLLIKFNSHTYTLINFVNLCEFEILVVYILNEVKKTCYKICQ